jgi:CDP-glucose 4,6-dehydratase
MATEAWQRRHVLVTGCTGLLGSWLTNWLVGHRADVVGLVRDLVPASNFYRLGLADRVTTVAGSVEDGELIARVLNEYEIEVVFHLAAQAIVSIANADPASTLKTNIAGTWSILEGVRRTKRVRAVIVASSDKAYGTQEQLPYRETAPLIGRHPYDVSKSCADLIAQMYWHTYGIPVAITRCGNFYGGGDLNFNRIVPGTVRSICDGKRPIIRSDGTMKRDYFHIDDAVIAYTTLAERVLAGEAMGEAFNFSNENPVTVLQLVERITALMGRADLAPVVLNQVSNEIPHQYLSAELARTRFGWRPHYSLDEGLLRTIAWYRTFFAETDAHTDIDSALAHSATEMSVARRSEQP